MKSIETTFLDGIARGFVQFRGVLPTHCRNVNRPIPAEPRTRRAALRRALPCGRELPRTGNPSYWLARRWEDGAWEAGSGAWEVGKAVISGYFSSVLVCLFFSLCAFGFVFLQKWCFVDVVFFGLTSFAI